MATTQRIVLTGAPGTGKSTVLKLLSEKGFPVHPEMARLLIREQQELDSELLPWKDHSSFGRELFLRQCQQYHQAESGGTNFYDRGIPDNLGYLRRDGLQNLKLEKEARDFPYFSKVFLTPPWKDIYNQDKERWEDFALMLEIHEALKNIYHDFGYQLIEVPRVAPEDRLDFIIYHLQQPA